MTGVRFLFRVTLRRHDLAAEVWHIKEPQKLPPVLSPEEVKRVLAMATSLKARAMLTLSYGCGLRASEVARLRAGDIDSEQMIIRIVQSKGRSFKLLSGYSIEQIARDYRSQRCPQHARPAGEGFRPERNRCHVEPRYVASVRRRLCQRGRLERAVTGAMQQG